MKELVVRPIGVARTPFSDKVEAPRQAAAAAGVRGRVELVPGLEHAVEDLSGWDRIWLVFWFDRAIGWKPKVLPPRSEVKRGVLATRAPHRPNPIGISAVRLERVEGLVLFVADVDLLDGTPILDVKPYVAWADAFPDAQAGWLTPTDPRPDWAIAWSADAEAALAWLAERGVDLRTPIERTLRLGPEPHPYRRIRRASDGHLVLAVQAWRARFSIDDRRITVERLDSGYRPKELATRQGAELELHRAFVARRDQST